MIPAIQDRIEVLPAARRIAIGLFNSRYIVLFLRAVQTRNNVMEIHCKTGGRGREGGQCNNVTLPFCAASTAFKDRLTFDRGTR